MQKQSSTFAKFSFTVALTTALFTGCSSKNAGTPEEAVVMFMHAACANDEAAMDKMFDGKASASAKFIAIAICKESGETKSFDVANKSEKNGVTEIVGKLQFDKKSSGAVRFKLKNTSDGWKIVAP